ncbi:hypothetical protein HUT18_26950 [Streptomyces sp. NA04227]|nr:hypothetical protein [Streptomyces sp. NA04227]QKW09490.1 hypothetical protein HUT18_26950 [Streptomyces sp. NA04227]
MGTADERHAAAVERDTRERHRTAGTITYPRGAFGLTVREQPARTDSA